MTEELANTINKRAAVYAKFTGKYLPIIGGAVLGAIGLASAMHFQMENAANRHAIRTANRMTKAMKKKEREEQRKYANLGYGYETYQEVVENYKKGIRFTADPVIALIAHENLVQDLYSNRTGHYKMGNAKFY